MRWPLSSRSRSNQVQQLSSLRSRALLRGGTVQIEVATGHRYVLERVRGDFVDVTVMYQAATVCLPLSLTAWLGPEFREVVPVTSLRTRRGDHARLEVLQ
jgi:hypothetical protein